MCMIDYADSHNEFSSERLIKASRKPHRCYECGREIASGESYWYLISKNDGDFFANHTCVHCRVACDWLSANCRGYLTGGVAEDIEEHIQEYRHMGLARLAVGMRRKWRRIRGPSLMPVPALPQPIKLRSAR